MTSEDIKHQLIIIIIICIAAVQFCVKVSLTSLLLNQKWQFVQQQRQMYCTEHRMLTMALTELPSGAEPSRCTAENTAG